MHLIALTLTDTQGQGGRRAYRAFGPPGCAAFQKIKSGLFRPSRKSLQAIKTRPQQSLRTLGPGINADRGRQINSNLDQVKPASETHLDVLKAALKKLSYRFKLTRSHFSYCGALAKDRRQNPLASTGGLVSLEIIILNYDNAIDPLRKHRCMLSPYFRRSGCGIAYWHLQLKCL